MFFKWKAKYFTRDKKIAQEPDVKNLVIWIRQLVVEFPLRDLRLIG